MHSFIYPLPLFPFHSFVILLTPRTNDIRNNDNNNNNNTREVLNVVEVCLNLYIFSMRSLSPKHRCVRNVDTESCNVVIMILVFFSNVVIRNITCSLNSAIMSSKKSGSRSKYNSNTRHPPSSVSKAEPTKDGDAKGLQTEIHPALLFSNLNLVRQRHIGNENPYLSHYTEQSPSVTKRYQRGLKFHEPGSIASRIAHEREEERLKLAKEEEERKRSEEQRKKDDEEHRRKVEAGELPDTLLGEEKYLHVDVPHIEWWDAPYVDSSGKILLKYTKEYTDLDEDSDDDDDDDDVEEENENGGNNEDGNERPSIRFVQHPVPISLPEGLVRQPKIYLTKREQRKIRRNRRKIERQEKDERINLGLEPKPKPKVKLSNMMSVYQNNENITDPTSWEQNVRKQVEDRRKRHLQDNQQRHEEAKKMKKEKLQGNVALDDTQICCRVFKLLHLENPKIRYKLDMNSKQLGLTGVCLHVSKGPGIIIVQGKEKSCKFYERLVLRRIKWNENFINKESGEETDMKEAKADLVWAGYSKSSEFKGWFMKECQDEGDLRRVLREMDVEKYYNCA